MGAAIQGGVIAGDVKDVVLLDVTPLSLGIETMVEYSQNLLTATLLSQHLNHKSSQLQQTTNQQLSIHVLQGERPMAADNKTLGRFQLTDIPAAPRGIPTKSKLLSILIRTVSYLLKLKTLELKRTNNCHPI